MPYTFNICLSFCVYGVNNILILLRGGGGVSFEIQNINSILSQTFDISKL
jgi:hypothetical protein